MGFLRRFDLPRYREHYGLTTLVETGTFRGGGVQAAIDSGFERVYSVELIDELYKSNVEKFSSCENVTILQGESDCVLDSILPTIDSNILFWLDAHCPGADDGRREYNAESDERIRCPLESELEVIHKHRAARADVFIIDDLRMYEPGNYEGGDLPQYIRPPDGGIEFVYRLFSATHHVVKLSYDEGYILLVPNDDLPKIYVRRNMPDMESDIGRLIGSRDLNTK
jgi:hypothetical protein